MAKIRLRRLVRFLGVLLALAVSLGIFYRPLLRGIGHLVVYQKVNFQKVDAVLVLAGNFPDRALQAADLFLQGRAEMVLLSREGLASQDRQLLELGIEPPSDSAYINREILLAKKIPATHIKVVPGRPYSTWEEAVLFREYAKQESIRSVAVVTCRYHSYRAYLNFKKALEGMDVAVYSVPNDYCAYHPDYWWTNRDEIKSLFHELASLTAFFLGKR